MGRWRTPTASSSSTDNGKKAATTSTAVGQSEEAGAESGKEGRGQEQEEGEGIRARVGSGRARARLMAPRSLASTLTGMLVEETPAVPEVLTLLIDAALRRWQDSTVLRGEDRSARMRQRLLRWLASIRARTVGVLVDRPLGWRRHGPRTARRLRPAAEL